MSEKTMEGKSGSLLGTHAFKLVAAWLSESGRSERTLDTGRFCCAIRSADNLRRPFDRLIAWLLGAVRLTCLAGRSLLQPAKKCLDSHLMNAKQ